MEASLEVCLDLLDRCAAVCLLPLTSWILLNGFDDLIPLTLWLRNAAGHAKNTPPGGTLPHPAGQARIAVFVPLWHEDRVIATMLERNLTAIRYDSYDFFVGTYPNDPLTIDAVRAVAARYSNVHLALCPHGGPTSKADCLNWIYQRMLVYEEQHGVRFEIVATHDAEDVIHPQELNTLNYYADYYDMVQIPVIPVATSFREFTHGLYCDDFAESQIKDMIARQAIGAFIPSCGVGTGFSRAALDGIAEAESNRIFEPSCLTEDYENGLRLHLYGYRQLYVSLQRRDRSWMATREYFPRDASSAIRQRTRWITGIALQTWERHGWACRAASVYWLWRDRKGLLGSPASLLANLLFVYGLLTWIWSYTTGHAWGLTHAFEESALRLLMGATITLQSIHISTKILCTSRIYGLTFALGAPLRSVWGNWINCRATFAAIRRYSVARLGGVPLKWSKTEHSFPSRATLGETHRLLGEVLVGSGYITPDQLADALASKGTMRVGEYLVTCGAIDGGDLCEALALQNNLACGYVDPDSIPPGVGRSLPLDFVCEWKALPFRTSAGKLFIASPEVPSDELHRELRKFTRLEIGFHLVTSENFNELQEQLLTATKSEKARQASTSFRSGRASE